MSAGSREQAESDRFEGFAHPRETGSLIGHADSERELLDAYRGARLPHAWVIGGPAGIGKATLAWRFARFLLANPDSGTDAVQRAETLWVSPGHPMAKQIAAGGFGDVAVLRREVNDKTGRLFSEIRVDDVRRASGLFQRASRAGGYRICILDSAEDLNASGSNALLKLIEEPPPLSLFLIVSHRPARLLPTLRSRCRLLMLRGLEPASIVGVLGGIGAGVEATAEALQQAAERGEGSVRGALRWLTGERLVLFRDTSAMLANLPRIDWRGLHKLADGIAADPDDFALLIEAVLEWLHGRMRLNSDLPSSALHRLAPLAEVWDKVRRSARDAEAFNLDKRSILFSIFADLAHATRLP